MRRWSGSSSREVEAKAEVENEKKEAPWVPSTLTSASFFLRIGPVDNEDLLWAVESGGKAGPPKPSINVEPVAVLVMEAADASAAAVWQPEGPDKRNPPLSSMTVPTKHEVDRVRFVEVVQHVGCVSQQDRKTT